MKYLIIQIIIFFFCSIFLLFLFQQEDFVPVQEDGVLNWYNVFSVLFFLFLLLQSTLGIVLFVVQKFVTCKLKEFPKPHFALKWSFVISLLLLLITLFNMFHIIDFFWGGMIVVFTIIILILLRF